jgi:hypothetical protein
MSYIAHQHLTSLLKADSAALVLSNLKNANSGNYWSLLKYMFDPTDGANSAGLSYIRIPLGSSDLSASAYTYCDQWQDTSLTSFSVDAAPSYVFSTLNDIQSINKYLKFHFVAWSPVRKFPLPYLQSIYSNPSAQPAWMKDSSSILGGNFQSTYVNTCKTSIVLTVVPVLTCRFLDAQYLLKSVQGWAAKGFTAFAIGIQVSDTSYYACAATSDGINGIS